MSSFGLNFLAAVVAEQSLAPLMEHGPLDHLFRPNEQPIFDFVKAFSKKYGKIPNASTIEQHTSEELPEAEEASAYYVDLMRERHIELTVRGAMKGASEHLKPENKDPSEALKVLSESVMQLMTQRHGHIIHDFRQAYDLIVPEYAAKFNGSEGLSLKLGWPTLDNAAGGFGKGDLVSLVGRPKLGKTWFMLYAAAYGWLAAQKAYNEDKAHTGVGNPELLVGSSRLLVSMEMKTLPIEQRLAAMVTKVSATNLKHAHLGSTMLKQLKNGLVELKSYGEPFWVVDGNLASTVDDVWSICSHLRPGAIFIDGGYLMQHPTERDRYRRVAENATLIKERLCPLAPTVVSWQFAKSASDKKKKKGEKVTYDDIGYTDAIAQLSTVAMGVFEEESVETMVRRYIDILAGRNGETGRFATNWDFSNNMDFSEIVEQSVAELQYL